MEDASILLVEDDADIRGAVRQLLSGENYRIEEAGSGEEGLEKLTPATDLIILDIMLPGISGLKTCEQIRQVSNAPVLFLTAKAQESDRLIGLMAGGDDYLPKPFSYAELLGRIKALLRRYRVYRGKNQIGEPEAEKEEILSDGDLQLNLYFNEVKKGGQDCRLSDYEYQILRMMMQHPDRIFSAKMLFEQIWQEPYRYTCANTIMVHIRKIRKKIEEDPQNPKRITTVWGKGYRFEQTLDR
jgi:two-component system OmpR family response regulator